MSLASWSLEFGLQSVQIFDSFPLVLSSFIDLLELFICCDYKSFVATWVANMLAHLVTCLSTFMMPSEEQQNTL